MKIAGVYIIQNLFNFNNYIGSSVSIHKRWHRHRDDLRKNKHHSLALQRAWNKYGENNFKFEILCACTKKELLQQEQMYLNKYKPAYNILKVAGSCLGIVPTQQHKDKIKKANQLFFAKYPEKLEKLLNYSRKPIAQLNKTTGALIKRYKSCAEAAKALQVPYATLNGCLTGKCKTSQGFKWQYI